MNKSITNQWQTIYYRNKCGFQLSVIFPVTIMIKQQYPGMGIKNGKVSWKVGGWEPQKAPSGGPGGNAHGGGQGAKPPQAF